MARHHPPTKEVTTHPVISTAILEKIWLTMVSKNMHKEQAVGHQPGFNAAKYLTVVSKMLEHLDRHHSIKSRYRHECVYICSNYINIVELPPDRLGGDVIALRT